MVLYHGINHVRVVVVIVIVPSLTDPLGRVSLTSKRREGDGDPLVSPLVAASFFSSSPLSSIPPPPHLNVKPKGEVFWKVDEMNLFLDFSSLLSLLSLLLILLLLILLFLPLPLSLRRLLPLPFSLLFLSTFFFSL